MENTKLRQAFDFAAYTDVNIFLTGKAGTGKTTFLQDFRKTNHKRLVVVAPTGVAAINAGGVTIHSFFQLPFGPILPSSLLGSLADRQRSENGLLKFSKQKLNLIRSLDMLVIDEISMVRADLLDGIDQALRFARRSSHPFGGVQLLLIGDLHQLSPVAKEDEWRLLQPYYRSPFFFESRALQQTPFVVIELEHIFRQSDQAFIDLLNKVRDCDVGPEVLDALNQRYQPDFSPTEAEGYITLTTHNHQAQTINAQKLDALPGKKLSYEAVVDGEFPEYLFPNASPLVLKANAQVMFIKNDTSPEKEFYNGKIGRITQLDDDSVEVQCPGDPLPITVKPVTWNNTRYRLNEQTNVITEHIVGTFSQFPLRTAWAITIHKSQGLTFEKAIIDASLSFAHGQVYVALSRCRSLNGLVLRSKVSSSGILFDEGIARFNRQADENQPNEEQLHQAKQNFGLNLLIEMFDFADLNQGIQNLGRAIGQNAGAFHKKLPSQFQELQNNWKTGIGDVAGKFVQQICQLHSQNPDIEHNGFLQERLKKAALYFLEHLQKDLLIPMQNLDFETDNKTIARQVDSNVETLQEVAGVKRACLAACRDGFSIAKFQKARVEAMVGKTKEEKAYKKTAEPQYRPQDTERTLQEALRQWRRQLAEESGLEAFKVMHQNTLNEIVKTKPLSLDELKGIKGIGKQKIKFFGDDILQIIANWYASAGKTPEQRPQQPEAVPKKQKEKTDTRAVSLELFRQGNPVAEIAKMRNLSPNTIHSHLKYCLAAGKLSIRELMEPSRIETLSKAILNQPSTPSGEIMEQLGNAFTWQEFHYVRTHLELNGLIVKTST